MGSQIIPKFVLRLGWGFQGHERVLWRLRPLKPVSRSALILTLICLSTFARSHPSHQSYSELEWSDGGRLDVAMRLYPEDLELALSAMAARPVVLRDTPEVRSMFAAYIGARFFLGSTPDLASFRFVGMELGSRESWFFFSLVNQRRESSVLTNDILTEVRDSQVNRVRRLWAPRAPTLVFTAAEPKHRLSVD
ncbi:MAG: DUF6702 family protein [Pseudomonadota bacterium]